MKQLKDYFQLIQLKMKIQLQTPMEAFKLKVREWFKQYLNTSNKTGRLLINKTLWVFYLWFLSDPDLKIIGVDKNWKSCFSIKKCQAINEWFMNNKGQLFYVILNKKDITQP